MRTSLLVILLAVFSTPVAAQTESEIEQKYGKPTLAYSVTEHIWMTPDYATNGRVCQMRFYSKRVDHGIATPNGNLDLQELKWILNHVVPPAARGKRSRPGLTMTAGRMAITFYSYEKVDFSFGYSIDIQFKVEGPESSQAVSFEPAGEAPVVELPMPPAPPPSSEADFDDVGNPEIALLKWKDRECVEDNQAAPVASPKVAEIEQQFGQPQKLYSVGFFTSMTPAFASDGQVCQMSVYPKRISGKATASGTLNADEVRRFLNTLVPPLGGFPPIDNAQQVVTIRWPKRTCAGF